MIERIEHDGRMLALIIRSKFREPGVHFFTPQEFSQQLGWMRHPAGKEIAPHVHRHLQRTVTQTQEVLLLRSGKLRVDLYDDQAVYLESRILEAGDVILLASGGHGFEVLEEVEMVEVKQGPWAGDEDKRRFPPVSSDLIQVKFP